MKIQTSANVRGVKDLARYYSGKKLHYKAMCLAKCADCMNGYLDGRMDCQIPDCPIYPIMPCRENVKTP